MERKGRKYVWADGDVEYLVRNYGVLAMDDIGRHLGVSHTTVRLKAMELGLASSRKHHRCVWTQEQLDYLRRRYSVESDIDLAERIGFSPGTVTRMAQRLGLTKSRDYDSRAYRRRYVGTYRNR